MAMTQQPSTVISNHRALVLDDNDANRMLLKVALQMGGIENTEAASGNSALATWSPGAFELAFLDIELPDISGIEVARHMRQQDNNVALIMCSTNDDPETVAKAVAVGCDMFFVKPFRLDVLMGLLKSMNRNSIRANPHVLVIDNTGLPRWENRLSFEPCDQGGSG